MRSSGAPAVLKAISLPTWPVAPEGVADLEAAAAVGEAVEADRVSLEVAEAGVADSAVAEDKVGSAEAEMDEEGAAAVAGSRTPRSSETEPDAPQTRSGLKCSLRPETHSSMRGLSP